MKHWRWVLGIALTVAACAALVAFYKYWQSWTAYETGSSNTDGTPPNYNYWSGFGSVFPWSMGILAALLHNGYQAARKNNCHTHGCWRIGSLPVGDYKVCKHCHLAVTGEKPHIEHLRWHYRKHMESKGMKP